MLFRKEAIDEVSHRLTGKVLVIPKISYVIVTLFLLVWLVVVIFWLFTSSYSRKESVLGWVAPSSGVVRVFNPLPDSVIAEVYVSEGQVIAEGQQLLLLNNSKTLRGGGDVNTGFSFELNKSKALLKNRISRLEKNAKTEEQNLLKQLDLIKVELDQINSQLKTLNQHESIVTDELRRYKMLVDKNSVSTLEYNRVQKELLSIQSNKQSLERSVSQQKVTIQRLNTELSRLPDQLKNDTDAIASQITEVDQSLLNIQSQHELLLKAPVAGQVNNIQANIGQRINATFPLLGIIPNDSTLTVNLLVPIRAAGFLKEGQTIDIRYTAFPYQKFGTYKATIQKIPETILLPNEIVNLPMQIREAVYKVEAELDESTILAYGKNIKIKPGMTLSADVFLSERTLVEWLLEPLYSLTGLIK